jgi:5-(carboxyamino)imidazole ribonucleotide synthase
VESDTPAAPAFDISKLVDVTVDAQGALRYGVDPATLQIGKDGVVRYVMVARSTNGELKCWPAVESVYHPQANMVDYLLCPARVSAETEQAAQALAKQVAEAFGVVGLLAVELFVRADGTLWVNECAPRPHNTGHHTIEANGTSQFAQLWRALLGLPLGDTALRQPAAMVNLVGPAGYTGPAYYPGLEAVLALPNTYVHLYGKAESRPFRKMGHITLLANHPEELEERVHHIKKLCGEAE